jgi:ribosomal protein S18 acetylase RimI-like enzyme
VNFRTRALSLGDAPALIELFRAIATKPRGFVRTEDEISKEYVEKSLGRGISGGVAIGAVDKETDLLVGTILSRRHPLKVFDHVMTGLIIGVHPEFQKRGIGKRLFFDFLENIQQSREDILRVELVARESNADQISFYESMGFRREGVFENRIRNADGTFENDIPMAWFKSRD